MEKQSLPGIKNNMMEHVEIYLSGIGLPKLDVMSNTDPYMIISLKEGKTGQFKEIGKTEIIKDNQNPEYTTSFSLEYHFEQRQFVKIECRDADNTSGTDFDVVGECQFELGQLVGCKDKQLMLDLFNMKKAKNNGKAIIRVEKQSQDIREVSFHI